MKVRNLKLVLKSLQQFKSGAITDLVCVAEITKALYSRNMLNTSTIVRVDDRIRILKKKQENPDISFYRLDTVLGLKRGVSKYLYASTTRSGFSISDLEEIKTNRKEI